MACGACRLAALLLALFLRDMQIDAWLARFVADTAVPDDVTALTTLCVFDWAACAMAGAPEPVTEIVRAQAAAEGGAEQASVCGFGAMRVPARAAALVNGTAAHALELDDGHFAGHVHPSCVAVAAALAVAERMGADGASLVEATAIGGEAAVRLGRWLGDPVVEAGADITALAGVFGGGLAAARLLGLDRGTVHRLIACLAGRAFGLSHQIGTMGRPLNAGLAAAAGIETVDLVVAGLGAPTTATDELMSLSDILRGARQADAWRAPELAPFDKTHRTSPWHFMTVTHRFHACSLGLQAMLEALGQLHLTPQAIDRVTIRAHPLWRSLCDEAAPRTGLEAKFSFSLMAAAALSGRDTADPRIYQDTLCSDPALVPLQDKVSVVFDAHLKPSACEIEIDAVGGRAHRVSHDAAGRLTVEDRQRRLREKADGLLGHDRTAALSEAVLNGPVDFAALTKLLRETPC